jgi:hypothetical protein
MAKREKPKKPNVAQPKRRTVILPKLRPLPIEFTEREIRLILKSLPDETAPEKLQWMAEYLPHWVKHKLPFIVQFDSPPLTGEPRKQVVDAHKAGVELWKRLAGLGPKAREAICRSLVRSPPGGRNSGDTLAVGNGLYEEFTDRLHSLLIALEFMPKQSRSHPRSLLPWLIIVDLAPTFYQVTGLMPARAIDRTKKPTLSRRRPGRFMSSLLRSGPCCSAAMTACPPTSGSGQFSKTRRTTSGRRKVS